MPGIPTNHINHLKETLPTRIRPYAKHAKIMWEEFIRQTFGTTRRFVFFVIAVLVVIMILIPIGTYIYFANDIKDKQSIINTNNAGVVLLDNTGKPFYSFDHPKDITYTPLSDITPVAGQAVIAVEDRNFYHENGFSLSGIFRAFFTDISSGQLAQGGSTITQQLVKTALLNSNKNFLRKYQEIVLALELERRFSKQDILEMYLNSVYFGEGAYGIENASEAYFNIHASDLDLAQSSLLAGLLPAPSALDPITNGLAGAKKRQTIVLDDMVDQGYITKDQASAAEAETLTFAQPKQDTDTSIAPHFALYIKNLLIQKYGEDTISRAGYTVKTTLNRDWQTYAETVVKNQVANLVRDNATNGAAVVEDPKTGEIEAMVGSEDWNNPDHGKVNMATTPRQPGSSFKPIVYSLAMREHLITPSTLLDDVPTTFPGNYKPHDYDYKYRGKVTVRRALSNSLNIPAVEVMEKVGVPDVVQYAQSLGITTLKDPSNYGLSLVLGAAEVPLVEMTNVYATFANQGAYNPPTGILEIRDKYNNVIYSYQPQNQSVIGSDVSYLISSILSDNGARAEEFGNALTISRPAAVKTGTTDSFKDAWTIGYTPSLAVGVWVGNNDNTPMDNIAGSLGAAPIWRQLMTHFLAQLPYETFKKPDSVIQKPACLVSLSGDGTASPSGYMEYYLQGTENQGCDATPTPTPSPSTSPSPTPSQTPTPQSEQPTNTPTPTPSPASASPTQNPTLSVTPLITLP